MQYKSSENPLYPIFIKGWKSIEKTEFLNWARENLTGQFLMINSSGYLEQYDRPVHKLDYFGELNEFAYVKESFSGSIFFTKPEDQTAFLIVFESVVEENSGRF